MDLQKIKILDARLTFPAGAILGLDTRQSRTRGSGLQEVKDRPGVYKVETNVTFSKGTIVWARESDFKAGAAEKLGATKAYMVPDPKQEARTTEHLDRLKKNLAHGKPAKTKEASKGPEP